MRRYLLFAGDNYYPLGGWCDFRGSFETPEQAKEALLPGDHTYTGMGWAHIVDLESGKVVWSSDD